MLFDFCVLMLFVRAVVPNEGHMAFNRPYQRVVTLLKPLQTNLSITEKRIREMSALAILLLVGLRGLLWTFFESSMLDFKVTIIPVARGNIFECHLLSLVAAATFLLQVYAFLTLAIAIGGLENRTDHYSRLMRALLGPLKKVPPGLRCVFPALTMIGFWTAALWVLMWLKVIPSHCLGVVGCVLGSIPLTLALVVDLARVWIVLIIVRAVFSFVPVWRPLVVDVIERITEPTLKPLHRLNLKVNRFDFTPVVSIVLLAVLYRVLLIGLEQIYVAL